MSRAAVSVLVLLLLLGTGRPAAADEPAERAAARIGFSLDKSAAMSIKARELEATREPDGRERVVFRHAVEAVQGDLAIDCDWLEALYGKDRSGGPERLEARGAVRIRQGDVEVRCAEAVFERTEDRALCRGAGGLAELQWGDDIVRGKQIEFDLASGVFKVRGGAHVTVKPKGSGQ